MPTFDPQKTGMVTAALLGGWHALWSVFVLLGIAQPLLDFIFRLHMINPPYTVMPFNLMSSVFLVIVTAVMGFVMGAVSAIVWNAMIKK